LLDDGGAAMLGRILRCGFLAVALLCGIAWPGQANDRDFTVINGTGGRIQSVWLSTFGDKQWHRVSDLSNLADGDTTKVSFDSNGPCRVQMRVVTGDGENHDFNDGFNLCTVSIITVYFTNSGSLMADYK
jgi:hypothetical protein